MENFLTVDDLSQKLQVSRVWLYKLVREKRIPFFHIEKCVRFSPMEINQWLEERRGKVWHRDKKLKEEPLVEEGALNQGLEIISN